MTTPAEATSIRHEVVVEAPIERAFSVFTERFDSFKPREHNLLSVEIAETVFESREGGHVYDRGVDGSECRWARVLAYEPPNRVVISWDISPHWQIETDLEKTSEVEVRFIAEAHARRARASQPRSTRGRLGGTPRGSGFRGRRAALPTQIRRRPRCVRRPRGGPRFSAA
jgi:uncharacterized protein YndB with AHSA1/START domain